MKKYLALFLTFVLALGVAGVASASTVVDRTALEVKEWDDPELMLRIRWSGVNFYEMVLPTGEAIVIDPYYDDPEGTHNEYKYTPTDLPGGEWVYGADYVLLTHGHMDHVEELPSILSKYPGAHIVAPEHVMPSLVWQLGLAYSSNHYFHAAGFADKLQFHGFILETCRSNHNLRAGPSWSELNRSRFLNEDGSLNFYELYRNIYEREIMNMRLTTDDGFTVLIWNSEMQADGLGFEDRAWFYQGTEPDLFMYQVAGASFDYDRRNPNYQHMGEWIASVGAKAGMPEHQQHFSYEELDTMAANFAVICDSKGVDTTFLTPETGVWYGYTKDADGNVSVYLVDGPINK